MSKPYTPQQIASSYLYGDPDYWPHFPDRKHRDPLNEHGPRVSWRELVERFEKARIIS